MLIRNQLPKPSQIHSFCVSVMPFLRGPDLTDSIAVRCGSQFHSFTGGFFGIGGGVPAAAGTEQGSEGAREREGRDQGTEGKRGQEGRARGS